ncbi:MAG: hypothetical protein GTN78_00030, partial [Gemmatimonadales bacterium]|nr:hypothetical protein [Gemmatimonadales bacterium]NIN10565.1 hypothetical protein [Gemmatimonadales bacterium]NIQ98580.1 hypothetical protein [Gemmatimonadales bacterium]
DFFVNGQITETVNPGQTSYQWAPTADLTAGAEHYCFVRVTQPGDRMTWSSPIWVTPYAVPESPGPAAPG